ncbi:MAG: Na(+)-translocating NADH-quinone reductase subunit C [Flavobacteriaceae bacterium]|jgi:Na+-transporting NADH:ubiquinone oxidoreductase subunit C|nr:Na(+)-translocating NADH-quinone reductase subunit C [Flavobacteriaceae bacterium]MDP4675197.1 Na(+)-translocating NADH-quinone reductase subunit C [Flavobacteriaceae bacterium]MDP4754853.1 Na(+)-translocating NADH-quinone reductase subunit C [Flavobacteriaceae bacterium]MDP4794985.1 Na(+)-translocating NADH-quinone reductase subunit C [Flavobacteriaceae bacterium]MDP4884886.1 Na(+)-translocating NADH-quinone reductase subunit C [Flavobacteriaceae bacterium]
MAINTEKNSYTIVFAVVMVVIVGSMLAFVSSTLKEQISTNERFEKMQNILYAMGVNNNDESSVVFIPTSEVQAQFDTYITQQLVIQDGQVTEDPEAYLIDLKREEASDNPRLPLFIGEKDGKKFYIVPMRGKGLWDAIWGFVSVDDQKIIQGAYFDHKGETPGLGANIKMRYFMDDFIGESIESNGAIVGVAVAKGNNDPVNEDKYDNEVDALAGATITGNGLSAMLSTSFSKYESFFNSLSVQ